MFATKTMAYPRASNDKSRAPAINAPTTIKATLIKPWLTARKWNMQIQNTTPHYQHIGTAQKLYREHTDT
jgi:hypothetical protein